MDPVLGLCQCGCGQPTKLANRTRPQKGHVKGEPYRFLPGHNQRKPQTYMVEDRGYATPCWIWQGNIGHGYGITREGKAAHRVAYERQIGPISPGAELHHRCDVKTCVNPDHLTQLSWHEHREAHNGPPKVTPEKARAIVAAEGTHAGIAERFGISAGYVGNIRAGWSMNEFTGLTPQAKRRRRRRKYPGHQGAGRPFKLSPEQVATISGLRRKAVPVKEIAEQFGVSANTIRRVLNRVCE